MAYEPHVRLTAGGQLVNGEVWTCTLNFANDAGTTLDLDQLEQVALFGVTAWAPWFDTLQTFITGQTSLLQVRAASINAAGQTISQGFSAPEIPVDGSQGACLPPQIAICLSLATQTPGPRGRGRIYLPLLGVIPMSNGRIDPGVVTILLDECDVLVEALETSFRALTSDTSWDLVVASGVGAGANHPVSTIRMGDVFDTQRRRRDALPENYQSSTV